MKNSGKFSKKPIWFLIYFSDILYFSLAKSRQEKWFIVYKKIFNSGVNNLRNKKNLWNNLYYFILLYENFTTWLSFHFCYNNSIGIPLGDWKDCKENSTNFCNYFSENYRLIFLWNKDYCWKLMIKSDNDFWAALRKWEVYIVF